MTALGADGISLPPTGLCTYGQPTGEGLCGRPATLHVCPRLDDGNPAAWTITACREHEPICRARAYEVHRIAEICQHPLAVWISADGERRSHCDVLPDAFAVEATEHEAVPA